MRSVYISNNRKRCTVSVDFNYHSLPKTFHLIQVTVLTGPTSGTTQYRFHRQISPGEFNGWVQLGIINN